MSDKYHNPFDLAQGLESVSGHEPGGALADLGRQSLPLPPVGQPVHSDLGSVLVQPRGIEDMLMRTLNPRITDKMSMAPSRYHSLLARSAANLMKSAAGSGSADVIKSAQLIVEELDLLRTMARIRGRQGG